MLGTFTVDPHVNRVNSVQEQAVPLIWTFTALKNKKIACGAPALHWAQGS